MSHFAVAVFTEPGGKPFGQLLAPYQENNMDDCPKEYLAFNDVTEEREKEYNEECGDMVKFPDGTICSRYSEKAPNGTKLWGPDPESESIFPRTIFILPEGTEEVRVPFKEIYPTFEQFMKEYHSETPDEETGKYGYWENPNAKWDWYLVGGRWGGLLLIKEGAEGYRQVNSAQLKDICWGKMEEVAHQEAEARWNKAPKEDGIERNLIYGIKKGETKDQFMERVPRFGTFAVITPDGKWHEKGEMGWWACASNEKESWDDNYHMTFIKDADPELTLTIVDCHI